MLIFFSHPQFTIGQKETHGAASGIEGQRIQSKAMDIFLMGRVCVCVCAYLIFVTGTTGAARVKIYVRCNFFSTLNAKNYIFYIFGVNLSNF